jgi:hypothetical protein
MDSDGGKTMIHSITWFFKQICFVILVTILSVSVTVWLIGTYIQQVLHELNIAAPAPLLLFQKGLFSSYSGKEGITQPISHKTESVTSLTSLDQTEEQRAPLLNSDEGKDMVNKLKNFWREGKVIVAQSTTASAVMSKEEIKQQEQALTAKEKMDILSLLISKMPQGEVEAMFDLISDGLTEQEAVQIDALLQKYLNEQEYQFISQIIQKYERQREQTS